MQLLLEVEDSKAEFALELISNLKFVKSKTISKAKYNFFSELSESVEEIAELKSGKKKEKTADEFLNEL